MTKLSTMGLVPIVIFDRPFRNNPFTVSRLRLSELSAWLEKCGALQTELYKLTNACKVKYEGRDLRTILMHTEVKNHDQI